MKFLLAGLLLCLWAASAEAQPACAPSVPCWNNTSRPASPLPGQWGYNLDTKILEYWNGSAWSGPAERLSVLNFGAKCDQTITFDDSTGINNAIAYAKANLNWSGYMNMRIEGSLNRPCRITDSINLTGINSGAAA